MATIDKLDISVYNMYALRTLMVEQINQQLRLTEAASIPPQTYLLDIYPKMSEIDILLGSVPLHAPWAYFFPPTKFRTLRRSPFTFARIAPSLGSNDDLDRLISIVSGSGDVDEEVDDEEEEKKRSLINFFEVLKKLNKWLGEVIGNVGRYLPG